MFELFITIGGGGILPDSSKTLSDIVGAVQYC